MTDVKAIPKSVEALTAVPDVWRAESFTKIGYEFAAALRSGRFVYAHVPELYDAVDDMPTVIKTAPLQQLDERAALNKRHELDTTLPLRRQLSDFLSCLFVADAIEYSEVLQDLYGEYTTGKGWNLREHDVSLDADGTLTWKETFPRAEKSPHALDWIQFRLIPGDSRVFRVQRVQSHAPPAAKEIIGAGDIANRLLKYARSILKAQVEQ